jgi:hypothetical protein
MTKLCERGKKTAQKKFKVYPSAYANAYAVQVCQGKKPDLQGKFIVDKKYSNKKISPKNTGLDRWFKEKWIDVCTGKPCGRKSKSKRKYPYCRPSKRINKQTPTTKQELTKKEIKELCEKKRKRPSKRISRKKSCPKGYKYSKTRKTCIPIQNAGNNTIEFIGGKKMNLNKFLSLRTLKLYEEIAKKRGVSKVARGEVKSNVSDKGFYEIYKHIKGNKSQLRNIPIRKGSSQNWLQRRNNFCNRHYSQMKKNKRNFFETSGKFKGLPTRQHLGLIFWACSPYSDDELIKKLREYKKN